MKITGVITEYNPFHNGHKLHIENTRKLTNADYIIAVMSGSFVQRGEPAVIDKYIRTEAALKAGVDLVVELPAPFSCASAEYFAGASIALLDKLGIIDNIVFGSECGEINALKEIARILADEPDIFKQNMNAFLRSGIPYPLAMSKAYFSCKSTVSDIITDSPDYMSSPNNMLGIEYIKALIKRNSKITPLTYPRTGSYNDTTLENDYPSASAIRSALSNAYASETLPEKLNNHIPDFALKLMNDNYKKSFPIYIDDFSLPLSYLLLSSTDLTGYSDVSADIENRIKKASGICFSCSEIIDSVKTKAFTRARISRCLMHILLDIKSSDMAIYKNNDYISYARILGFKQSSKPLLSEIKKHSSIPLITKLAGYEKEIDELNASILRKEIFASDLYQAAASNKYRTAPKNEFTEGVIII